MSSESLEDRIIRLRDEQPKRIFDSPEAMMKWLHIGEDDVE